MWPTSAGLLPALSTKIMWFFCFVLQKLIILFFSCYLRARSIDGTGLKNMNIAWLLIPSKNCKWGKSPTNYTSLSRRRDRRHKHGGVYGCSLGEIYSCSPGCTALSFYKSICQTPSRWVNVPPKRPRGGNEKQLHWDFLNHIKFYQHPKHL